MLPSLEASTWSKIDNASRIAPSAFCAITLSAAGSAVTPLSWQMYCSCSTMSGTVMRAKS